MRLLNRLIIKTKNGQKIVDFGLAEDEEEIENVFRLRYEVYSRKNYIIPGKFKEKKEKDEYDIEGKCYYFVAKVDNKIIGTVRLIKDEILPTEEYFRFNEPPAIKRIPRGKRAELGRLIVVPYKIGGKYLPRHIVLLFLIKSLVCFGKEHDLKGGYAFIKKSLERKLKKLRVPIHLICLFEKTYPPEGILLPYFSDFKDSVVPMYFLTSEIEKYVNSPIFSLVLKKKNNNSFVLRGRTYSAIIKLLSVLN